MSKKVVLYFLLPMLILAFFLSFAGVHQITFGNSYYTFMKGVSSSFENWKFTIPNIPNIPSLNTEKVGNVGGSIVLTVLRALGVNLLNIVIKIFNGMVSVINFLSSIVSIFIQIVQFFLTLIYKCKDFIRSLSFRLYS